MALADTIPLPGEPPIGKDGISAEWLRQQMTFNEKVILAVQELESQINAGRKTT